MALMLKRRGITQVRPLHGGFTQWIELGFPTSGLTLDELAPIGDQARIFFETAVKQSKVDRV